MCAIQVYDSTFIIPSFQWLAEIPPPVIPLINIIILVIVFVVYSIRSEGWLIMRVLRTIAAPFCKVYFNDFFIADQIISISIVLYDIEYTICYYIVDAFKDKDTCKNSHKWILTILAVLPLLWRFLQCLRRYRDLNDSAQLLNAGKYLTSMILAVISSLKNSTSQSKALFVIWLIIALASTTYSYSWDILRDWSLIESCRCCNNDKKCTLLRSQRMYPKFWYYSAMLSNLLLRVLWTLTISPDMLKDFGQTDIFTTLLACLEVTRRAIWNVFRLENEQVNNCGKYRAYNEVPLPLPLRRDAEKQLYTK